MAEESALPEGMACNVTEPEPGLVLLEILK